MYGASPVKVNCRNTPLIPGLASGPRSLFRFPNEYGDRLSSPCSIARGGEDQKALNRRPGEWRISYAAREAQK